MVYGHAALRQRLTVARDVAPAGQGPRFRVPADHRAREEVQKSKKSQFPYLDLLNCRSPESPISLPLRGRDCTWTSVGDYPRDDLPCKLDFPQRSLFKRCARSSMRRSGISANRWTRRSDCTSSFSCRMRVRGMFSPAADGDRLRWRRSCARDEGTSQLARGVNSRLLCP